MPLIGVTTFRDCADKGGISRAKVNETYIQSVIQAGGIPLLIPVGLRESELPDLCASLDGFLFTGGDDINPAIYHGNPHPSVDVSDDGRDSLELTLVKLVIDRKIPFLGICRGCQMMNIALGGTLYTDIKDQKLDARRHSYLSPFPRDQLVHMVLITQDSLLASITGKTELNVNSLHHQGINRVSPQLKPTALSSEDGLVEALEFPDHPFALGVQWHPEELLVYPEMRAIFQALVVASSGRGHLPTLTI
jgi:putative glutamine amidotransferase